VPFWHMVLMKDILRWLQKKGKNCPQTIFGQGGDHRVALKAHDQQMSRSSNTVGKGNIAVVGYATNAKY
jgi:hypothetical protein